VSPIACLFFLYSFLCFFIMSHIPFRSFFLPHSLLISTAVLISLISFFNCSFLHFPSIAPLFFFLLSFPFFPVQFLLTQCIPVSGQVTYPISLPYEHCYFEHSGLVTLWLLCVIRARGLRIQFSCKSGRRAERK
jgi:hypothetical protein